MDLGDISYVVRTRHTRRCISQHTHRRCLVDHHERTGVRRLGMHGAYIRAVGRPSMVFAMRIPLIPEILALPCRCVLKAHM